MTFDSSPKMLRRNRDLKRLIPLVPIRHFYWLLRDFPSIAFHQSAAEECLRRTECLDGMIRRSCEHFDLFDNEDEGFRPSDLQGRLSEARRASQDPANVFLVLIHDASTRPEGLSLDGQSLGFVDYEVSPYRTTKSEYENGLPSKDSGVGGADVLLVDRSSGLPVVGEIKAATDVNNAFLAFIQTLTYAVELSTRSQRTRLARHYPGVFRWPDEGPYVDLLMMLEVSTKEEEKRLMKTVEAIISKLRRPGSAFSQIVRRVTCMSLDFTELGLTCPRIEFGFRS